MVFNFKSVIFVKLKYRAWYSLVFTEMGEQGNWSTRSFGLTMTRNILVRLFQARLEEHKTKLMVPRGIIAPEMPETYQRNTLAMTDHFIIEYQVINGQRG